MKRFRRWYSPVTGLLFFIGFLVFILFGSSFRSILDPSMLSWFQKDPSPVEQTGQAERQLFELQTRFADLEAENRALRQTLHVVGTTRHERILSHVLWRDPDPARRAVRISMTETHPFVAGDILVAPGDVLVGRVTAVYRNSADVLLMNDPEFRISVRFGDIVGTGYGDGREGMHITFVPAASLIPPQGTAVYSAGLEGEVPQNIFLGWLRVKEAVTSEPFANLFAISAAALQELEAVSILRVAEDK